MATVAEPAELPSFEPRSRRASDASTAASTATGTIHGASLSPRTGRLAGHVQQKEELPERGCGCISCLPWARHPFFEAAELGDHERVAEMLEQDITLAREVVGQERKSAWHLAAEAGHLEVLRALVHAVLTCREAHARLNSSLRRVFLLARTTEVLVKELLNQRSYSGTTPLALAARQGHAACVDYLLSVGANAWVADYEGMTPLHHAAMHARSEVIHELLKQPPPFSRRASRLNTPNIKYVDAQDHSGFTALHMAVLKGHAEAVTTLLSHEANLIARTVMINYRYEHFPPGTSALHIASWNGSLQMVKLLLRAYFETAADLLPSQTAMLDTQERRRRQRSHPDPRLILTRTARLPYHFAHRNNHSSLLEWLDPSIPLMFLLAGEEPASESGTGNGSATGTVFGVPRLTVLAAKALHELLLVQLEAADTALKAHMAQVEAAREAKEREKQKAQPRLSPGGAWPTDPGAAGGLRESQSRPSLGTPLRNTLAGLSQRFSGRLAEAGLSTPTAAARAASRLGGAAGGAAGGGAAQGGGLGPGPAAPVKNKVRPRRASHTAGAPTGTLGAHTGARRLTLLERLTLGVRSSRRGSGLHNGCDDGGGDLLRMGLTIPADVDRDHVAQFHRGLGLANLGPLGRSVTAGGAHHNTIAFGPGGVLLGVRGSPGPTLLPPLPSTQARGSQSGVDGTAVIGASPQGIPESQGPAGTAGADGAASAGASPVVRGYYLTSDPPFTPLVGAEDALGSSPLEFGTWPLMRRGHGSAADGGDDGTADASSAQADSTAATPKPFHERLAGLDVKGSVGLEDGETIPAPGVCESPAGLPMLSPTGPGSPRMADARTASTQAHAGSPLEPASTAAAAALMQTPTKDRASGGAHRMLLPGAAGSVPSTPTQLSGARLTVFGPGSGEAAAAGLLVDASPHGGPSAPAKGLAAATPAISGRGAAQALLFADADADNESTLVVNPATASGTAGGLRARRRGSSNDGGHAGSSEEGALPHRHSHQQQQPQGHQQQQQQQPGVRENKRLPSLLQRSLSTGSVALPDQDRLGGGVGTPGPGGAGLPALIAGTLVHAASVDPGAGVPYGLDSPVPTGGFSLEGHDGRHSASGAGHTTPGALMQSIKARLRKMSSQVVPALSSPFKKKPELQPTLAEEGEDEKGGAAGAKAGAGAGAGSEGEDETCPVCLDELPNIKLQKCGHTLCVDCCKDLCRRHNLTPALCPYCRTIISGFSAAPRDIL